MVAPPRLTPERAVIGLSLLVLLAATLLSPATPFAADATLTGPRLVTAEVEQDVLTLRFDRVLAPGSTLSPAEVEVTLNGRAPTPPVSVVLAPSERRITLHLANGAGSADVLTVAIPRGAPGARDAAGHPLAPVPRLPVTVRTEPFRLPDPRSEPGAFVTGDAAYVLGGWKHGYDPARPWQGLDSIVRVNLTDGAVRTLDARLPTPLHGIGVAHDPRGAAYLFGGAVGRTDVTGRGPTTDLVLRYDPAQDLVTPMDARLPTPRAYVGATWADGIAVLAGGRDETGAHADVLQYDPDADRLHASAAPLTQPASGPAVVWDPRATARCPTGCAYALGGWTAGTTYSPLVHRVDPRLDLVTPTTARIPDPVQGPAVWAGDAAYLVGGLHWGGYPTGTASVQRFDPLLDLVTQAHPLQQPHLWHVAIHHDSAAHILAGYPGHALERVPLD